MNLIPSKKLYCIQGGNLDHVVNQVKKSCNQLKQYMTQASKDAVQKVYQTLYSKKH